MLEWKIISLRGDDMGLIVAIGGGEIAYKETLPIDRFILDQVDKNVPKVLFIPTASRDHEGYIATFKDYYEGLGATVDCLKLVAEPMKYEAIAEKINRADVIYVGGGNTAFMLDIWQQTQTDVLLRQAYEKGKILSGLSAGSICWFTSGHSDSLKFASEEAEFILVSGLNLIPGIHCPHYNELERKDFDQKLLKWGGVGLALENGVAFAYQDGKYKIIKTTPHAKAYRLTIQNGQLNKIELINETFEDWVTS